jgi:electron transport complex protein RnfG
MINFLKKYKVVAQTIFVMLLFGLIFSAFLSFFYEKTNPIILKSEAEAKERLLLQVITKDLYDNDLSKDFIEILPNPYLKNKLSTKAYLAKKSNEVQAVILETRAPDGYSGDIYLLVGINRQGEIIGSRVIKHQETPGLGDYIDIRKGKWIEIFKEASLKIYSEKDWGVIKDNGKFDYVAGATITPRAVIKAIHNALIYFEYNKQEFGIDV